MLTFGNGRAAQLLALGGDGASVNDKLAQELQKLLPSWGGSSSRVWCFLHILNLISKIILGQFDAEEDKEDATVAAAEEALKELMDGLDLQGDDADGMDEEGDGIDEHMVDQWIEERLDLTEAEREALKESMAPVKTLLMKVRIQYSPLNPFLNLTPSFKASKALQRCDKLVDVAPARVEETPGDLEDGCSKHAAGCGD